MSIDLRSETILRFPEVKKRTPFKVHVSTLHRWRLRGVRGVKLETAMLGGGRVTSLEALERFVVRVSESTDGGAAGVTPNTAAVGQRIQQASALLDAAGIR